MVDLDTAPDERPTPDPKAEEAEPPTEPREEDRFHPHKHGHVAIRPAETAVTHLDPGAVTFS